MGCEEGLEEGIREGNEVGPNQKNINMENKSMWSKSYEKSLPAVMRMQESIDVPLAAEKRPAGQVKGQAEVDPAAP